MYPINLKQKGRKSLGIGNNHQYQCCQTYEGHFIIIRLTNGGGQLGARARAQGGSPPCPHSRDARD